MKEESKYIELAKKLKALADRGKGGEKYNAQLQLDRIMLKHGITKEMLEEDLRAKIMFKFPRKHRTLFIQICLSIVGDHRYIAGSKKKKNIVLVEVSKLEQAEILAMYNFYSRIWQEELEIFEMAFVQKNNLVANDGERKNIMDLSPEEREKALRILEAAQAIKRADYKKQLQ